MTASLKIDGRSYTIDPSGDLASLLTTGEVTFEFAAAGLPTLAPLLADPNATLAGLNSDSVPIPFSITPAAKWNLGRAANISVIAAAGNLTVAKSAAAQGSAIVTIELRVSWESGNLEGYSSGLLGVKSHLPATEVFPIRYRQFFPSSATLGDALPQAFSKFVFPFRAEKIVALTPGHEVEFEFLGKLALGFGLLFRFSAVQLGGRSAGEIVRAFRNPFAASALESSTFAAEPFERNGAFVVPYTQEDEFRLKISREKSPHQDRLKLTISAADPSESQINFDPAVQVAPGVRFDFNAHSATALRYAVDGILSRFSKNGKIAVRDRLLALLVDSQDAIAGLALFIDDRVQQEFGRDLAEGIGALNDEHQTEPWFEMYFDLSNTAAPAAIQTAMQGDVAAALRDTSATLTSGSFVEKHFSEASAFAFEFFDLDRTESALEYLNNVQVTFAGNGSLRMAWKEEVQPVPKVAAPSKVGLKGICDVFFRASALKIEKGQLHVAIDLAFDLLDQSPDQAAATRQLLSALNTQKSSQELSDAAEQIGRFVAPGAQSARTRVIFPKSSFAAFQADLIDRNGTPPPMPHEYDQKNYSAFVAAIGEMGGGFLGFDTYEDWCTYNRFAIDGESSTITPNRLRADEATTWPADFNTIVKSRQEVMRKHSESARHFINLVAALESLCEEEDSVTTQECDRQLVQSIAGILDQSSQRFLKASLLALLRLAGGKGWSVNLKEGGHVLYISIDLEVAEGAAK